MVKIIITPSFLPCGCYHYWYILCCKEGKKWYDWTVFNLGIYIIWKTKKKSSLGWPISKEFWIICPVFQFSSVTQSCPTFCNPMNRSTPGLPVHHQLLEFTQTHGHRVGDAIQPSHPLLSSSPPALNLSQHQSLFKWVSSLYQLAKVLEFQLQHQSFQWTPRTDLL